MKWKRITKESAKALIKNSSVINEKKDLSIEEEKLCEILTEAYKNAEEKSHRKIDSSKNVNQDSDTEKKHKKEAYLTDLYFGISLFEILGNEQWTDSSFNNKDYVMNVNVASDNGIWMYLCVNVVPNIIHKRWFNSQKEDSLADHVYAKPARNYLKSLWWYIYLSKQNSREDTFNILKFNSTDTIVSLVERTGQRGYEKEFSRRIMQKFSVVNKNRADLFRSLMKLHHAKTMCIEPCLVEGGLDGYIEMLFDSVIKEKAK